MSRVIGFNIPPENRELFFKNVTLNSHYTGERVDKKAVEFRIRNFKKLVSGSGLVGLKGLWRAQSDAVMSNWFNAASWAFMNGWDLFKLDTMYRIYNGIKGVATPSLFHQFMVGDLYIPPTVNDVIIRQTFSSLPNAWIEWGLNLKHALASTGSGSYATLKFFIHTGYWNDDINAPDDMTDEYNILDFASWGYLQNGYSDGLLAGSYLTIEIAIHKMTGHVYMDGGELWYNDTNWFNDFQFDDCGSAWEKILFPAGSTLQSIYPADNI